jgi:hypothetical protein
MGRYLGFHIVGSRTLAVGRFVVAAGMEAGDRRVLQAPQFGQLHVHQFALPRTGDIDSFHYLWGEASEHNYPVMTLDQLGHG